MRNLKAHQRSQLIYEFGILIQPIEDLARARQPPSMSDYRIAIAKVQASDSIWRQRVEQFATFASDLFLRQEYNDISHVPERCLGALKAAINDPILCDDLTQLNTTAQSGLKLNVVSDR